LIIGLVDVSASTGAFVGTVCLIFVIYFAVQYNVTDFLLFFYFSRYYYYDD